MMFFCFFLFNDTATTEIYTDWHTLSLHDALPSCLRAIVDLPAPEGDDRTNRTPRRLKPCGSGWSGGEDGGVMPRKWRGRWRRSEEHTSELKSLMRISYAVFCLKKKTTETEQDRQC